MIVVGGESGNGLLDDVQVKIRWRINLFGLKGLTSSVFLQFAGAEL